MNEKINELLEEKINEIFYIMQTELNITSGDISPIDDLDLDMLKNKLAVHIEKILEFQKGK